MRPLRLPPNSSLYHKRGHLGSETKTGLCPCTGWGVWALCDWRGKQTVLRLGGPSCQPRATSAKDHQSRGNTVRTLPVCRQLRAGAPPVCPAVPEASHTGRFPHAALTGRVPAPSTPDSPGPERTTQGLPGCAWVCHKPLSCRSRELHSQRERSGKEGPGVLPCLHERKQDRGAQGQAPDGAD